MTPEQLYTVRDAVKEARTASAIFGVDLLSEMRCAGCGSARPWLISKLLGEGCRVTRLQYDAVEDLISFAVSCDNGTLEHFHMEHFQDASQDDARRINAALLATGEVQIP